MPLFLTACATPSNGPEIVERVVYVGLPTSLLKDCTRVDLGALSTNGDMAKALLAQDESLASCNADKEAIRQLQPQGDNNQVEPKGNTKGKNG